MTNITTSKVYIIGAGPGDPQLITVKGYKILQQADVILYDRLVNIELIKDLKAEKIYVGKKKNIHYYTQDEINRLLVSFARSGKVTVRLKGGDPFIFGRGGEEIEFLIKNGVDFEIVPGLSSITAIATNIGLPLTHRGVSSSIAVVTGHSREGKCEVKIPKADTILFLMGLSTLPKIVQQLKAEGYSNDAKIAVISKGTLKGEHYVSGTLSDIIKVVKRNKLESPCIVIFGNVIQWYDDLIKLKNSTAGGSDMITVLDRITGITR